MGDENAERGVSERVYPPGSDPAPADAALDVLAAKVDDLAGRVDTLHAAVLLLTAVASRIEKLLHGARSRWLGRKLLGAGKSE